MRAYNTRVSRRYKYVCSECGSEDIEFNAYGSVGWDKETQSWYTIYIEPSDSDYEYCRNCEDEVRVDEVIIRKKKLSKL